MGNFIINYSHFVNNAVISDFWLKYAILLPILVYFLYYSLIFIIFFIFTFYECYFYYMFIIQDYYSRKSSNLVTGLQKFPTSYKIKVKKNSSYNIYSSLTS